MSKEEENEYIEKISRELDELIFYKNIEEITATEIIALKQPIWLIFADLLNKIRKKDAYIQRLQELLEKSDANNVKLQQEMEIKDKIIDDMADYTSKLGSCDLEGMNCNLNNCKECIKEYFRKKVDNNEII